MLFQPIKLQIFCIITMLVILLFFIVEYIFLKQFVKLLKVKYTYLLWFVLPFFYGTPKHFLILTRKNNTNF